MARVRWGLTQGARAGLTPLAAGVLALVLVGSAAGQVLDTGGTVPAADPTLFFAEGNYYVFSTGLGLPLFRSADLVTWTSQGRVFDTLPDWAQAAVPNPRQSVWAPDVVRIGDEYRVYWSTSTIGSRRSVIGLVVNRTLDPASPEYRWVDRGKIIETMPDDDWNAIDPQCFVDQQGRAWLVMGSYWSGIKLRRLDLRTGRLSSEDTELRPLARRTNPTALEGAYLIRRKDHYYLFVSFGRCNRGIHNDYDIRVGRSREVTGPYVDDRGQPMLESGGTLVLTSHGTVRGPGHGSVLQQGGRTYLAHHYFNPEKGGQRTLQVRPVFWDEHGWPMAGEPVAPVRGKPDSPAGPWAYSVDFTEPLTIRLNVDHALGDASSPGGQWSQDGECLTLTFAWAGSGGKESQLKERCFLGPDGSWFVGRNRYGQIVRGRKLTPQ